MKLLPILSAGLLIAAGAHALTPSAQLVVRDAATGLFTLKARFIRSTTLDSFEPFPMAPAGASINADGELEYQFTRPDPRAFFRLESR